MESHPPLADELAAQTARIADLLLSRDTAKEGVQALAQALKEAIPGTAGAGVSLIDTRGRRISTASTDAIILQADQLQYELGQGPCLTAWAQEATMTMEDSRTEHRWPAWTRTIADLPLRSAISTPLATPDGAIGALKVYSPAPNGFGPTSARLLELLARPAALILANAQARDTAQRLSEGIIATLGARDATGTATGIIMERLHINRDQALAALITAARQRKQPVHLLAQEIIDGAQI
jgi:transcriptional regulator with GAF, ATPase, and Fis domain